MRLLDGLARVLPSAGGQDASPESWPTLLAPNVDQGWMDGAWRTWPAPESIVHSESRYSAALVGLTGPPRQQGYIVPVAVVFRPEPANPNDPKAVRVEVGRRPVGYVARDVAAHVAEAMYAVGVATCVFAGLLRGGYLRDSESDHNVGVLVWPSKRIGPAPSLSLHGGIQPWHWPPDDDEGRD